MSDLHTTPETQLVLGASATTMMAQHMNLDRQAPQCVCVCVSLSLSLSLSLSRPRARCYAFHQTNAQSRAVLMYNPEDQEV